MDEIQPLPLMLIRRKTHRVKGPRPCSWLSSSSDSSFNEHQDIWPWTIQGPGLCRRFTLRSTASHESSDFNSSSSSSSSSSSPMTTLESLPESGEGPHYRRARRQKPAGPRAPPNNPFFDERPRLVTLPVTPQPGRRDNSPGPPPVQIADADQPPRIPPPTVDPSANFLLDWDAIFEMLGCS